MVFGNRIRDICDFISKHYFWEVGIMSSQANFPILSDVTLHTTLNNLMESAENRLRTLDKVSEVIYEPDFNFRDILSAANRICINSEAAAEVVFAIQQLLIFYTKYADITGEWIINRLEKRYILFLKTKITKASMKTMQAFDQVSINLFNEVLRTQNVLKTKISLDKSVINNLKKQLKGGEKS